MAKITIYLKSRVEPIKISGDLLETLNESASKYFLTVVAPISTKNERGYLIPYSDIDHIMFERPLPTE